MSHLKRYLQDQIVNDAFLSKKIAFVSGPRQVGKTTLVESLLNESQETQNYFSWDDDEFRKVWTKNPKSFLQGITKNSIIGLDEIHKDRMWKNKLKGLYDIYKSQFRFVVTGSARLDFYRKSGDSLQGRYFPFRLHPFSVGEINTIKPPPQKQWDEHFNETFSWQQLLQFSGFPEPLIEQNTEKHRRWQRLYRERMIREDLRDLQDVRDVNLVESLSLLLHEKVASQLSYESLREDLSISFDTTKRWIDLFEALYFCYRIRPYSKNIKNSIKKEPKLYLFDWSLVNNEGARFENLVASHLLKSCHAWTDAAMGEFDLFYLRDKQKREVDFLVTKNNKPFALIEAKSGQSQPTPSLLHYQKILSPQFCIQVVKNERHERASQMKYPGVHILSAKRFLGSLV